MMQFMFSLRKSIEFVVRTCDSFTTFFIIKCDFFPPLQLILTPFCVMNNNIYYNLGPAVLHRQTHVVITFMFTVSLKIHSDRKKPVTYIWWRIKFLLFLLLLLRPAPPVMLMPITLATLKWTILCFTQQQQQIQRLVMSSVFILVALNKRSTSSQLITCISTDLKLKATERAALTSAIIVQCLIICHACKAFP